MKKFGKILSVLCSGMLLLSGAACGGGGDTTGTGGTDDGKGGFKTNRRLVTAIKDNSDKLISGEKIESYF